jgi:catechol 2,3-dioxygenase-like lactoylglutathione lyase family enzyme
LFEAFERLFGFMALGIIEINHVNITVPKAAEESTRRFYEKILGLDEIPKPDSLKRRGGAWFKLGALELHLSIEDVAEGNDTSRRHICYLVADIGKAEQHMRDSGVEVTADNQPVAGWLRFYVHDPGGNRLEIAQRDRESIKHD